jgi:2-polyprenyl-3-methyl-5-hydroxy-6-metoxy-1,4-benzoquinol methylase
LKNTISFLPYNDELSILINKQCYEIYNTLSNLDINKIEIEKDYLDYFIKCHLDRPIFTLKTSAVLLYNAIKEVNLPLNQIQLLDYGAGVSTVYLLAKKIGIHKVYYNDMMPNFIKLAQQIDTIFNIKMDDYIVGDSEECFHFASKSGYIINLVVSRNVIEHIYNLNTFFEDIHKFFPEAIVYNSTTANWENPITHIQHIYLHKKNWNIVKELKKSYFFSKSNTDVSPKLLNDFLEATKSIGNHDFDNAINEFIKNKKILKYTKDYTNICTPEGSWVEHLIPHSKYLLINKNYEIKITPGLWDTNYSIIGLNLITSIINKLISISPNWLGNIMSPFIYIIANPKK